MRCLIFRIIYFFCSPPSDQPLRIGRPLPPLLRPSLLGPRGATQPPRVAQDKPRLSRRRLHRWVAQNSFGDPFFVRSFVPPSMGTRPHGVTAAARSEIVRGGEKARFDPSAMLSSLGRRLEKTRACCPRERRAIYILALRWWG